MYQVGSPFTEKRRNSMCRTQDMNTAFRFEAHDLYSLLLQRGDHRRLLGQKVSIAELEYVPAGVPEAFGEKHLGSPATQALDEMKDSGHSIRGWWPYRAARRTAYIAERSY